MKLKNILIVGFLFAGAFTSLHAEDFSSIRGTCKINVAPAPGKVSLDLTRASCPRDEYCASSQTYKLINAMRIPTSRVLRRITNASRAVEPQHCQRQAEQAEGTEHGRTHARRVERESQMFIHRLDVRNGEIEIQALHYRPNGLYVLVWITRGVNYQPRRMIREIDVPLRRFSQAVIRAVRHEPNYFNPVAIAGI